MRNHVNTAENHGNHVQFAYNPYSYRDMDREYQLLVRATQAGK